MSEKLPTTSNVEDPEHNEDEVTPEQLEHLQEAADGASIVLQTAMLNGEPREGTVETAEGLRGFIESTIPGGRVEGLYSGTGKDAELKEINLFLEGGNGTYDTVSVELKEGGQVEFYANGERVQPEQVPAVVAMVEQIQQEQAAEADAKENAELQPGIDQEDGLAEDERD